MAKTSKAPSNVTTSQEQLLSLGGALQRAALPTAIRALVLGGGAAGQKQIAQVLAAHEGSIQLIDSDGTEPPSRMQRIGRDPFAAEFPADLDLCVAMPPLARMPDMIEGVLYDGIHGALREGGIAIVPLPRDCTGQTLISQGATLSRNRECLQSFLMRHFGGQTIAAASAIAAKFASCPFFDLVAIASRTRPTFAADPVVWLLLRKRRGNAVGERAFPKTPRPDQFALSDLEALLCSVQAAGVSLLPVDQFAARYKEYLSFGNRRRKTRVVPFGHLKFDIHGNVRRAHDVAKMLHKHSIPGLFLMMHRHPMTLEIFDSPATWQILRGIQNMGHEIGIHADPFCLIREAGNLHKGLQAAIEDLRARGLTIRAATLHGDTREHIKARQLQANDFFREKYRRSKWDGLPPEGEEELAKHTYIYSYRRIANQFGIDYFAEVNFQERGKLLTTEPMMYVSDNARAIRISSIPKDVRSREVVTAQKPFVIDADFIRDATDVLRQRPFLALFHPQWYW